MNSNYSISLTLNNQPHSLEVDPRCSLAAVLRDQLDLMGTKIGCEAGDCGACTVLLNNQQICACITPIGQCDGSSITTVEAARDNAVLTQLQTSFLTLGATQCGICTPGMLMSALALLQKKLEQSEPRSLGQSEIEIAIGGTLCRCTGYIKIIEAVAHAAASLNIPVSDLRFDNNPVDIGQPESNTPPLVGQSLVRIDGLDKVNGHEKYAADTAPESAYWLRVVRSPYANATFELGSLTLIHQKYPGLVKVLQASDVPGHNGFGIYPNIKDQPVLADGEVIYRGQAVLALIGDKATVESIDWSELPLSWKQRDVLDTPAKALEQSAALLHSDRPNNILISGRVHKGRGGDFSDPELIISEGRYQTAFVEHAYIEPEAGYALREGNRITVFATTQAPVMDLEEVANVLGLDVSAVRIIPSACGGGFGGKLDVSVQPLLAVAAWVLNHPVRMVMNRIESMVSSTKRHPALIHVKAAVNKQGKLQAFSMTGDFDTGAYASWGPTVAGRVPLHCTGPYAVPNVHCTTRAIHTNSPPSGAFRGFGTPQAAIARELNYDELATKLNIDRWQFRRDNVFQAGDTTPSGQKLTDSVGMSACLDALAEDWLQLLDDVSSFNNRSHSVPLRRGAGIACMWYGCGNTGLSNPSSMRVALRGDGRLVFYNGAVDIGQGSSTVLLQICADAVGLPLACFDSIIGDTDLTDDAGKTSASRQTFVSGKAAQLAGFDLRRRLLSLLGANNDAALAIDGQHLVAQLDYTTLRYDFSEIAQDAFVAQGHGSFDPPITPLDENGQGQAYATYAFAAQICTVDVDMQLGRVYPRRIIAAHDVGRAVNPQLVEGQIHGGIVQGIGMALMEEYVPGLTENLHDYLIPTAGDVPEIDIKLIEAPEPLGPYGAKGVGEPALVPTPAAILGAVRHASGVTMREIPALPSRIVAAFRANGVLS